MKELIYRALDASEIDDACALVWDVFLKFVAPDYEDEGVLEFYNFLDPEYLLHRVGDGEYRFWGAFDKENLVGVCAMRSLEHISLLFVDEKYQRSGVATALLKRALIDCKKIDMEINRITVHSSPYALPFYEALGFIPLGEEITENGIRFVPMELLDKK